MTQACRNKVNQLWENVPNSEKDKTLPGSVSNAGLLMSRYLELDIKDDHFPDAKTNLFRAMQKALEQSYGIYGAAFERYRKLIPKPNAERYFRTSGRMIIGLGNENTVDTGLSFNNPYGTPIIPGTALKGLASHFCHQVWGSTPAGVSFQKGGEDYRTIFGTDDYAGHITFHDAWITPATLKGSMIRDIITPHHKEYYSGEIDAKSGALHPPTDFDKPTPIAFLSIEGEFCIAVSCDVSGEKEKELTIMVLDLLSDALKNWGIGGKTSSGYGRMVSDADSSSVAQSPNKDGHPKPRHSKTGPPIEVTRVEDYKTKKGNSRPCFIADDGCLGLLETGTLRDNIVIGNKVKLKVHSDKGEDGIPYRFVYEKTEPEPQGDRKAVRRGSK